MFEKFGIKNVKEFLVIVISVMLIIVVLTLFIYKREINELYIIGLIIPIVEILGTLFAYLGSKRADKTHSDLKEAQIIASESTQDFEYLFKNHLMAFMPNGDNNKPIEITLVISTPAFGLHPLDKIAFNCFLDSLKRIRCSCELILYTPDAHYFHWLNTIIWENMPKAEKSKYKYTTAKEFLECLYQMKILILAHLNSTFQVWASNENNIRMFNFNYGLKYPQKSFLVLVDKVTIHSDLKLFKGRSFPVPKALQSHITEHSEKSSYYNQFKFCPYSLKYGEDAKIITNEELRYLFYDYFLGRTEQSLFNIDCFQMEMNKLCRNSFKNDPNEMIKYSLKTLSSICLFFKSISDDRKQFNEELLSQVQKQDISYACNLYQKVLKNDQNPSKENVNKISESFLNILNNKKNGRDSELDGYRRHKIEEVTKILDNKDNLFENVISIIYYFITSGFTESLFSSNRYSKP